MPYEWQDTAPDHSGALSYRLRLWPYQSLPRKGFVWFIGVTAAFMALPVVAMLGTAVLWGLLPFALLVIGGLWYAIQRSYAQGEMTEELILSGADIVKVGIGPGSSPASSSPHSRAAARRRSSATIRAGGCGNGPPTAIGCARTCGADRSSPI